MHAEGWKHYLGRLGRLAASGDAGPDEGAWAPEELTATTAAEASLAAAQPVLRNLEAADLSAATPCEGLTCGELVDHLLGSMGQLGAMAGTTVSVPDEGTPEERVSVTAAQAVDGWRSV